jgi:DNA-binding response OmpR family regulator
LTAKILIVDDEPDILQIAKLILEEAKYQVIIASDGELAIHKAEAETPDLMLLDIRMPEMNGFEVCKRLKALPKTKNIPIIMFTILAHENDKKTAKDTGASGYIVKPFTPESLLSEVKKHIKK